MQLMAGQLVLGAVYRFTFNDPFTPLGYDPDAESHTVAEGFYRVEELLTHEQILERGQDLVEFLFGLVGLTEADYQAARAGTPPDDPGYIHQEFVQLVHVVSKQVVFMPASAISEVPIVNVKEYNKLVMPIDFGVIEDVTMVNSIRTLIRSLMLYEYGIDLGKDENDYDLPELMIYDTQWMTEGEYADIESGRTAVKGDMDLQPTVLAGMTHPTNIWGEMRRLRDENTTLRNRISALEAHLIDLATPPLP